MIIAAWGWRVSRRRNPRPEWIEARCRALGQAIASARTGRGWSQDDLAVRAGVDRRSIQRYEAAAREPRIGDVLLIAHALDMPVEELLSNGTLGNE